MKSILVINSKQSYLKTLAPITKDRRFDFIFAKNGSEGLEAFKKNRINVVISHLGKSRMDDMEFMFYIHEIRPNVPIIIIIQKDNDVKKEQFMKAGAFACLYESASISEIIDTLNQAILKS